MFKKKSFKIIIGILVLGVLLTSTLNSSSVDDTKSSNQNSSTKFKFKPANFRIDTPFMCVANISKKTAKFYLVAGNIEARFDGRPYVSSTQAPNSIRTEIHGYQTADHYSNPNTLFMELEVDGSSLRISGDSVDYRGIVYSCWEVDEN